MSRSPARLTRIGAVVALASGLLAFVGYEVSLLVNRSKVERYLSKNEPFGILLAGQTEHGKKTKTRFCAAAIVVPSTSRIGFVSLFPETRMTGEGDTLSERIAADGIDEAIDDLEQLTDVKIPFHLIVKPDDAARLIDLIEGVDYFMLKHHVNKNESLPTGEFVLDGALVRRLLTVEPTKDDFSSARTLYRQYSLLLNLWRMRTEKWSVLKEKAIFNVASRGLDTNLSGKELYHLAETVFSSNTWLPMFIELPVKRKKDQLVLDIETTQFYVKKYKKKLGSKENPYIDRQPKMEIQNGTRQANLARKMHARLSRKGIRVIEFANAERDDYKESVLLDTNANPYYLSQVTQLLEPRNAYHAVNRAVFTDLVLIVGRDHKNLKTDR